MIRERLQTWVPDERPRAMAATFHGDVNLYAALSPEDRERGHQLRAERVELGLTLRQAADLLGLHIVDLSECERGVRRFDLEIALDWLRERCVEP